MARVVLHLRTQPYDPSPCCEVCGTQVSDVEGVVWTDNAEAYASAEEHPKFILCGDMLNEMRTIH